MINLATDLTEKLEAAGFDVRAVCTRADVSPSTITLIKRRGNCSQRTYDKMLVALLEMCRERNKQMEAVGLMI